MSPQRWNFRSNQDREHLILSLSDQLAELAGHWCHLRVTHRPESARQWAQKHHELAPAGARLPDTAAATSFDDYLAGEQQAIEGRQMTEKQVYLGVLLTTRTMLDRTAQRAPRWLRTRVPQLAEAELHALADEIERVTHIVGGMGGALASETDMDWLLSRSHALGLPIAAQRPVPSSHLEPEDLATFTDLAEHVQQPYAPTLTVRGTGALAGHDRSVCVLSLGQMQPLNIPESDEPWMSKADMIGAAVEWSARFYVRPSESVSGELTHQMDKVRAQVNHYTRDHDLDPPMRLERQHEHVRRIDDEMSSGLSQRGTRLVGWWRLAVSAPTEDAALDYARRLADLYKPSVRIEHPAAQHAYAREFMPGEALATRGYQRRGSVVWAAASLPQVTSSVGDHQGLMLGETVTRTVRPVAWDPWLSQREDGSGLTALLSGLGGGKSVFGGMAIYKSLWMGAQWTVLDPSGPLARLATVPELAPYTRTINLLDAKPGTLNPYRIVPEPQREHYADEADPDAAYRRALTTAAATRRRLTLDTLTGLLPYEVQTQASTRMVLNRAIRACGGQPSTHPGHVLRALKNDTSEDAEHARNLHDLLDEVGERMQLLIPQDDADPYGDQHEARLTVLTMPGLTLPKENVSRKDWDGREQESVVLLNLAAWLTQRNVYDQPMSARKGVFIDEASFLAEVSTGKMLMNRFARDSRKWALRVLLASQVPADLLRIPGIESLLDSVFAGKLSGDQAQEDALNLLDVPIDQGFANVFATFPDGRSREKARHFLFRDSRNNVERIRADFSAPHLAHVLSALNTTPGDVQGVQR
ncbi:ATP-binding protein [Actinopolyspora alba]|uniref:ATP-binding protein n=1 Tax=Actinopolyspora alba TaxID=673379 RepID=UPI001587605B|nr:ATP-binding protein [Actinopolyspora alba]